MMRNTIIVVMLLVLSLYTLYERSDWFYEQADQDQITSIDQLQHAYDNKISNLQVEGSGVVKAILKDDTKGSRHQRIIVDLPTGQTILVAHNIDLAPRVENLNKGDEIAFFGEYEWNKKGGVIHWTHHDPQNKHVAGWLRHNGRTYR
jgi:hypothetical protein